MEDKSLTCNQKRRSGRRARPVSTAHQIYAHIHLLKWVMISGGRRTPTRSARGEGVVGVAGVAGVGGFGERDHGRATAAPFRGPPRPGPGPALRAQPCINLGHVLMG